MKPSTVFSLLCLIVQFHSYLYQADKLGILDTTKDIFFLVNAKWKSRLLAKGIRKLIASRVKTINKDIRNAINSRTLLK